MSDVTEDVTLLAHIRAIDEGASAIFNGVKTAAGALGGALVGVYQQSLGGAMQYAEQLEKVSFLTGMTTEKSAGLISAFRAQGFTTEEATMSMQRLTMRLGAYDQQARSAKGISAQGAQALAEMGLSAKQLLASGGDLTKLFPSIIDHLKNMKDPLERDRLSMQLFGRNFGSIAPLIHAGGAAFLAATADANRFGVALSEENVADLHKYKAALETTKEAVQGITLQLALQALPYFQKLQDIIKQGIAWWDHLTPAVHKNVLEIMKLTAVFGTLFGGAAALRNIILPLTRDIPVLGQAFGGVLEHFIPFFGIIGPLIGIFLLLRNEWQHSIAIQKAFAPVLKEVGYLFETLQYTVSLVVDIFKTFFSTFSGSRGGLDAFIASLAGPLLGALIQVQAWVARVNSFLYTHEAQIEAAMQAVVNFAKQVGAFLKDVGAGFLDALRDTAVMIRDNLTPAFNALIPQVKGVIDSASGLKPIWDFLRTQGKPIGEAIFFIVAGLTAWKAVTTAIMVVQKAWIAIQALVNGVMMAFNLIMDANPIGLIVIAIGALVLAFIWAYRNVKPFHQAVDQLIVKLKEFAGWVTGTAVPAVTGFVRAVIEHIGAMITWISTTWNNLVSTAEHAWQEFSSRPIYWIVFLVASAVMWFAKLELSLIQKAASIVGSVAQWFSTLPGKIINFLINLEIQIGLWEIRMIGLAIKTGQGFLAGVGNEITKLPGQVVGFMGGVWNAINTQAPQIVARGLKMAQDFVSAIINALYSLLTSVPNIIASAFGNAAGQAKQALHDAHVPGFAQGRVVGPGFGGARMAVVGEGNEAEVIAKASSLIRAGMEAARGSGGGGMGGNIIINTYLDGRLIEKRVTKITGQRMRLQGAGLGSAA